MRNAGCLQENTAMLRANRFAVVGLVLGTFGCWLGTAAAWGQDDDCLTWEQRANTPSFFRKASALAYDSSRKVVVLFGGRDTHYRGDTWE